MRWCLITVFALYTQVFIYCHAEQCNRDQLDRCELAIIRILENNNGLSQQDTESYCRNIYRRLHCLITQTAMCIPASDRQRKSPLIYKTWRYLASICDGYAAWWRLDCYQQDGVKHCESRFTDNRNVNYESCRNYRQFRECASMVVKSRCSSQQEALLGIYLLDKGRERTWLCAADDPTDEDNHVSSAPLASGSDYQNDEDCRVSAQYEAKKCSKSIQEIYKYSDQKTGPNEEKCCAMKKYEECASDIIKRYCGGNDWSFLDSLKHEEFGNENRCPDSTKCPSSSANRVTSIFVAYLVLLVTVSNILFG